MKKEWFVVGIVIILVPWLVVGCGISEEVYNTAVAERDSAQAQVTNLQGEVNAIQTEYDDFKAEYDDLKADYAELKSDYDELNNEFEAINSELTQIKEVYPPGDFKSVTELEDWVRDHVQSDWEWTDETFRSALIIQSQGLEDGYLISVVYDEDDTDPEYGWIFCATLVNGVYYTWHPADTEVWSYADLGFTR